MAVRYQLVINCVGHPEPLARFWAEALGYVLEPPPAGFATWDEWRRDIGLPESWLGRGTDCIIDPDGAGPRIWIQVVPDRKTTSNRLHIDIHATRLPRLKPGRRQAGQVAEDMAQHVPVDLRLEPGGLGRAPQAAGGRMAVQPGAAAVEQDRAMVPGPVARSSARPTAGGSGTWTTSLPLPHTRSTRRAR